VSTAAEVLALGRMHVDGGVAADGTRVLSEETVRAMQERQVESPDRWSGASACSACGLGWKLFDLGGRTIFGHDGTGFGQLPFLRMPPDAGFGVALLANSYTAGPLYLELFTHLFGERGIAVPDRPQAADRRIEVDPSCFVGTYERIGMRTRVLLDD